MAVARLPLERPSFFSYLKILLSMSVMQAAFMNMATRWWSMQPFMKTSQAK